MSSEIINTVQEETDGIIFIGGFQHTQLIKLLEQDKEDFYRYAIFSQSCYRNESQDWAVVDASIFLFHICLSTMVRKH